MNPVLTLSYYFFKIPSMPKSSKLSLPFRFSDKNFVQISHTSYVCYISSPQLPWLYQPNSIWWRAHIIQLQEFIINAAYYLYYLLTLRITDAYVQYRNIRVIRDAITKKLIWKVWGDYKLCKRLHKFIGKDHSHHLQSPYTCNSHWNTYFCSC